MGGGHEEKGRKEGPDSLAFCWPPGTRKSKTQSVVREPAVQTGGRYQENVEENPSSLRGGREGFSERSLKVKREEFQNRRLLPLGLGLYSTAGQVTPPGCLVHLPAGSSGFKMSTFLSLSSKHPITPRSVRRYAPEPCGTGRSAPSATWTFWSTSWW